MRVDKNEFNAYLKELNEQSPGLGDKILESMKGGKSFRNAKDNDKFVEWGYLDQNNEF